MILFLLFDQPIAKLPRIGVLWQTAPPSVHPQMTALLQGLKELGWEDGKSVVIEYRYGGNRAEPRWGEKGTRTYSRQRWHRVLAVNLF